MSAGPSHHPTKTPALHKAAQTGIAVDVNQKKQHNNAVWEALALGALSLQPKLTVSQPGDPYEQEADRVADQVMRMAAPGSHMDQLSFSRSNPVLQRKCNECEREEEQEVQRKTNAASIDPIWHSLSLRTTPFQSRLAPLNSDQGSMTILRQTDQTEEGRRTVREGLGQYIAEMRFAKVINDCPTDSGVRLRDALMRVRGRVDRNTQCLEFFQRQLGGDLLAMLSPFRPPSFTINPSLTGSGHTRCPSRPQPGHPPQAPVVQLGLNLCNSPLLDRVIVHELAHQTGCGPRGTAAAWDETVANQAATICIGTVQEQLQLRDQAAANDPTASAEDWDFTALDLRAIQQRRMQLRFQADSNWFPQPLRENLRNTIIYLLAPSSAPARTEGINPSDFFHGHLVVPHGQDPQSLLSQRNAWTHDLVSTRQRVLGAGRRVTAGNLEPYRREVGRLAVSSGPLLTNALRAPGAAVIYHTFEFPQTGSPQDQIRRGSPRRNFRTPLSTNVPAPYSAPDPDNASSYQRDYTHIFQFAFLIDRTGVIHVRPDFIQELSDVVGRPLNRQP